jgi:D-alanyl-D-alanine carboxypeptidase
MANWGSIGRLGNPLSPGWQEKNLTWISPVKGQRWQVYAPAASAFQGLLGDLQKEGYNPTSSGGFNYRPIRGSDKLSQHAFGTAIDVSADENPLGGARSNLPANTGELARKWGLEWGGNWKSRPDPMHFEYAGGTGGGAAPADGTAVASAAPQSVSGRLADRFNASPGMQMVNRVRNAFTGQPQPDTGTPDASGQKPQSIGGLLGQVASSIGGAAPQQQQMSVPDLLPQGGGQQQGGSLQDYIQKYIASRMQGQGGGGYG